MSGNKLLVLRAIASIPPSERRDLRVVRLCGRTGLSERTIRTYISILHKDGSIKIERKKLGMPYSIALLDSGRTELNKVPIYE